MKIKTCRFWVAVICIISVLALFSLDVFAAASVENKRNCSLKISFTPENIKASSVKFNAYKAASLTPSYEFALEPEFAEHNIAKLFENPTEESYNLIAATLSGIVVSDAAIKPYAAAITDSSGIAEFKSLKTGLYLITGEIYRGEDTYYTPQNFMVSLPGRTTDDLWNYDVFAEVKWEKRSEYTPLNLEVLKVWSDSSTNLHTDDNVTVLLYKDNALYDTRILNKENNWSFKWDNLFGGASWSIKEKDVKGYIGTVERKEDCFVITNTPEKPVKESGALPQTGLLWWPVPILSAIGIILFSIGIYLKKKGERY